MSQPYADLLREFEDLLDRAARLPRGGFAPASRPASKPGAPRVLVLAPHPDDECIVGALPLRLQRESGWSVGAAPVTLGSRVERRAERRAEFERACAFLGWDALTVGDDGLAGLLRREKPALVLFPHADDANSTHRRVHGLVVEALPGFGSPCAVAETEYWSTMSDPNLMVEAPSSVAADLVAALSFHEGEVARNPYHVLLPSWLVDGARRGAELVGGQGSSAPEFRFASLYRLSRWDGRALSRVARAQVASAGTDLSTLLG